MNIAADVGTTFQLGRYTVRVAMRQDNPAFAKYLIFRNNLLVGRQFSRPSLSDCEWLEKWGTKYADVSFQRDISAEERRTRGGDAERRRRELIAA
jgi:hypothetical protein